MKRSTAAVNRKPYRGQMWVCEFNPMPAQRRDLDEIPRFQRAGRRFVLEAQLRFALQQQYPLGLRLLVPKSRRTRLAAGHDALDSDSRVRQQPDDLLLLSISRDI